MILLTPLIASAAWWNPLDWFQQEPQFDFYLKFQPAAVWWNPSTWLQQEPQFDFYLKTVPTEVSVVQGQATALSVIGTRIVGDFATAKLSVSGLPQGATAEFFSPLFDKTSFPCRLEPECSTSLEIKTSPDTPVGKYPITITGTAHYLKTGGDYTRKTQFILTVTSTVGTAVGPCPAGVPKKEEGGFFKKIVNTVLSPFRTIPPSIAEEARNIFAPLEDNVVNQIPLIIAEEGDTTLTDERIQNIRTSWTRLTLGISEFSAGTAIEDAACFQGIQKAIEAFTEAQGLAAVGNPAGAIREYEKAFAQARTARRNGISGPERRLPFQVVLAPDFLSTKSKRKPEFGVLVLGATGQVDIKISGHPPAVKTEITAPDPKVAVFTLKLALGDIAPGRYVLKVTATEGRQNATKDLILNVQDGKKIIPPTGEKCSKNLILMECQKLEALKSAVDPCVDIGRKSIRDACIRERDEKLRNYDLLIGACRKKHDECKQVMTKEEECSKNLILTECQKLEAEKAAADPCKGMRKKKSRDRCYQDWNARYRNYDQLIDACRKKHDECVAPIKEPPKEEVKPPKEKEAVVPVPSAKGCSCQEVLLSDKPQKIDAKIVSSEGGSNFITAFEIPTKITGSGAVGDGRCQATISYDPTIKKTAVFGVFYRLTFYNQQGQPMLPIHESSNPAGISLPRSTRTMNGTCGTETHQNTAFVFQAALSDDVFNNLDQRLGNETGFSTDYAEMKVTINTPATASYGGKDTDWAFQAEFLFKVTFEEGEFKFKYTSTPTFKAVK